MKTRTTIRSNSTRPGLLGFEVPPVNEEGRTLRAVPVKVVNDEALARTVDGRSPSPVVEDAENEDVSLLNRYVAVVDEAGKPELLVLALW
jgi:hypothetical protein